MWMAHETDGEEHGNQGAMQRLIRWRGILEGCIDLWTRTAGSNGTTGFNEHFAREIKSSAV